MESINDRLINELSTRLDKLLEEHIIIGLRLHGHEFNNINELYSFVKNHCSCDVYGHLNKRVYKVDGVAFLLYNYDYDVSIKGSTVTANYGSIKYIKKINQ